MDDMHDRRAVPTLREAGAEIALPEESAISPDKSAELVRKAFGTLEDVQLRAADISPENLERLGRALDYLKNANAASDQESTN